MRIDVQPYTYETMPEYNDEVEGAKILPRDPMAVGVRYLGPVAYDRRGGRDLVLKVLQPRVEGDRERTFPAVLYVQGSHWGRQDLYQAVASLALLAHRGYVCAVVEYRDYGVASFPAPIVDAKNAVRYLRRNAEEFHVDPARIVLMGNSSGGEIATIAGMTATTKALDDPTGPESCEVAGMIDLYGAVDPTMPDGFPTTLNHQRPGSPECMYMGFDLTQEPERAKAAVSKTYVNNDFGPILILHGTKDRIVFCQQSVDLYRALVAAHKDVELYLVPGADHGGDAFWSDAAVEVYDTFIKRCCA